MARPELHTTGDRATADVGAWWAEWQRRVGRELPTSAVPADLFFAIVDQQERRREDRHREGRP